MSASRTLHFRLVSLSDDQACDTCHAISSRSSDEVLSNARSVILVIWHSFITREIFAIPMLCILHPFGRGPNPSVSASEVKSRYHCLVGTGELMVRFHATLLCGCYIFCFDTFTR